MVGLMAGSTAVVADGVESASDIVASSVVLFGLVIAGKPPDENHPYGHGRLETLMGGAVGMLLAGTGVVICVRSLAQLGLSRPASRRLRDLAAARFHRLQRNSLSRSSSTIGRKVQKLGPGGGRVERPGGRPLRAGRPAGSRTDALRFPAVSRRLTTTAVSPSA